MRKMQKVVIIGILSLLLLSGCNREDAEADQTSKENQTETVENSKQDAGNDKESDLITEESKPQQKEEIVIYYVDMNTAEITSRTQEVDKVSEDIIWQYLQQEKLLTQECGVNSFECDVESGTIDIDVNQGFGDYIRGMGTSGESQIIECVSKSYLESYDCTRIKITENGQPLSTGHAIMDDYITYE